MSKIIKFFDRLEDKVRTRLARQPILYAVVGGVGIVLFWRGVWHIADDIGLGSVPSLIISLIILLTIGLFVSFFVGENIIITGIKKEKKLVEKAENEIKNERDELHDIKNEIGAEHSEIAEVIDEIHDIKKGLAEMKEILEDKSK